MSVSLRGGGGGVRDLPHLHESIVSAFGGAYVHPRDTWQGRGGWDGVDAGRGGGLKQRNVLGRVVEGCKRW